jgi:uncharacterized protein YbcC (UPF0753/DUF2309 family)
MPKTTISETKTKQEALAAIMDGYSSTDFTKIFTSFSRITRLDRYINHRTTYDSQWQEYPITLEDYLAVRLWVAKKIDAEIYPEDNDTSTILTIEATIHLVKSMEKS